MVYSFSHTKITFLPKNTTLILWPLNAGIIQNFKVKYGKRLVKYVLVRISGNSSATSIIKDGNILMGIQWAQEARKNKKQLKIILRSVEWSKVMTICWKLRKMT